MYRFTKIDKYFRCELRSLIAVKDQLPLDLWLGIQRLLQCPDRKVAGDVTIRDAGNDTSIMQNDDGAVIAHFMICKEKIGEISTPFLGSVPKFV